jgi:hypothetical protein
MPTGIVLFPNPQAINRVDDVVEWTVTWGTGQPPSSPSWSNSSRATM